MRQDQYERLVKLEEELADVFIFEAETKNWSGAGLMPNAMDQQTRGDRYWCKRNAVATLSLMQRVASLVGAVQQRGTGTTPAPDEPDEHESNLDAEVRDAEKEAARLMRDLQRGGKARANGRPAG